MKKILLTVPVLLSLLGVSPVQAQNVIEIYSGFNNQVIGILSRNEHDDLNICNDYGSGGSIYSINGVYSSTGVNGSSSSAWGAYNDYAITPPYLYVQGKKVRISTNRYLPDTIHPDALKGRICR